jgi:hypothetical protein
MYVLSSFVFDTEMVCNLQMHMHRAVSFILWTL